MAASRTAIRDACDKLHELVNRSATPDMREIASHLSVLINNNGSLKTGDNFKSVMMASLTEKDVNSLVSLISSEKKSLFLHFNKSATNKDVCTHLEKLKNEMRLTPSEREAKELIEQVNDRRNMSEVYANSSRLTKLLTALSDVADKCEAQNSSQGDKHAMALIKARTDICASIIDHATDLLAQTRNRRETMRIIASANKLKAFQAEVSSVASQCHAIKSPTGSNLAKELDETSVTIEGLIKQKRTQTTTPMRKQGTQQQLFVTASPPKRRSMDDEPQPPTLTTPHKKS